jgi:hypothetical protein
VGLQNYINQQLNLIPSVDGLKAYIALPLEDKFEVRQALYKNPHLIARFVSDNPYNFSPEQLDIVSSWKKFVADDFYIERLLKKHTIFIDSKDVIYGVLGLHDSFDEMIHKSRLPLYVKTVLLPFKGQIVYDGLLQGSNIIFGGGIKGELKQVYLLAKETENIVLKLDTDARVSATAVPTKNIISEKASQELSPLFNELITQAKSLRGGKGQPVYNGPIFSLIKASLELGQVAVDKSEDRDQMIESWNKVARAFKKAEDTLYRRL